MADILIVDDKADIRELISEVLQEEFRYAVACAKDTQGALEQLSTNPKVVILDIWLEGSHMDGVGLLKIIKQRLPKTQIIMISGHGNIDIAVKTIKLGAYDFIEKPFKTAKLLIMVERAMEKYLLLNENNRLKSQQEGLEIIGQSKQITKLRSLIDSIALKSNSRVVITGGHGVGKATVAQVIHNKSSRYEKPFLYWHVTNKSPDVITRELFGDETMSSVFTKADGGTLFINDFLCMSLETQSELLQILKNSAVGNHNFDVRIIAATTGSPEQALSEGSLGEALYYNLNIARINLPLLSQRKGDIELLSREFIKLVAEAYGNRIQELGKDVLKLLKFYDWPGNVRQLKNVIEWLIIVANSQQKQEITTDMLPAEILSNNDCSRNIGSNNDLFDKPIKEARDIFEKSYIEVQLERFNGNISKTADFIKMDRAALHRKIKCLQEGSC
ncbi:MAG: DNA-binding transcriptional response regulator, NtrC family, contains REC, AAA-type ATPase, and a Fis-type DNA-binding domains [Candidatus Midichloria mitochondrii]|uniref:Putative response regulator NtrX-like n=1 Tax=Midichloria mitochondrii (strain IricVA) TaxID=696127 RepID=F7XVP1_MIDMI|nr:sigma-54 dependent transcriptional regulator [Candidatus Midichloria mitochondrii]AEI88740.1 phosphoglycerate mutase [Candidatus Midichloria mitochondrii IricVA]MDJ1256008.1 sigma-54 dependent transcriptional regulator [Candidatus Midichloria mitochondrii]MDJ1287706.1 sigma-54 dependent transcriptional regulator [Candidatus Midichloria mitochondrii]MDJ1298569.1 sigma-54 dependent transcriptional regulator [Candidatus Midichloria mitochondrii]MDJ1312719.1 sigma-54 dependent transcriptional r